MLDREQNSAGRLGPYTKRLTRWMLFECSAFLAWAGFLIPIARLGGRSFPESLWVLWALWIAGFSLLLRALWLERRSGALRAYLPMRHARVTFGALVLILLIAVARLANAAVVLVLMFTLLIPIALWAFSATAGLLARRVTNAALLTGGLVGSSLVFEGTLRVVESRRPFNDYSTTTWGRPVISNRFGFRERDFAVPKPPGTYRVMVLGDSLTWGPGLSEDERYTDLTETLLRSALPGLDIEVLNFGLTAASTTRELEVLLEHVDRVEPDLIVVGFCINDPQPGAQDYAVELERFRVLFAATRKLQRLGARSTGVFLHRKLDLSLRAIGLVPNWWEALDRTYDERSDEWQAFEKALKEIKAISDARRLTPPLFVPLLQGSGDFNHPDAHLTRILRWTSRAEATARALGFDTVDLLDSFRREGYRDRSVNRWDNHPDARSNELYARGVAAAILETLTEPRQRDTSRTELAPPPRDPADALA